VDTVKCTQYGQCNSPLSLLVCCVCHRFTMINRSLFCLYPSSIMMVPTRQKNRRPQGPPNAAVNLRGRHMLAARPTYPQQTVRLNCMLGALATPITALATARLATAQSYLFLFRLILVSTICANYAYAQKSRSFNLLVKVDLINRCEPPSSP